MTQESTEPTTDELTDARVAAWLEANTDFLTRHPEVLCRLTPPERDLGDGVADMQTAMIETLRGQVERLKSHQDEFILTSRANLNTQGRVHECVLAMLAAKSFEQAIQAVTTDFAVLLDLDIVTLCVEAEADDTRPHRMPGLRILTPGTVDAVVGDNHTIALRSDSGGDPEIFGGGAALVRSAAFIRLDISDTAPPALIAFGARRNGKFHAGQGTELLNFLGRVVEHGIRLWLDLPG